MPWNKVLHKFKAGTLKSGSGHPVQSKAQAVAIMLSEKRKAGSKPEYRAKHQAGTTNVGLALFRARMAQAKNRKSSRA
jgi:hypothetical protein